MNSFLSFLNPLFRYIDEGKLFRQPFQVLYYIIGILTCFYCLYFIARIFNFIQYGFNGVAYIFAVLMCIVLLAAGVLSLFYWFKRAQGVGRDIPEFARFLAIPTVGNFIITFGEWLGLVAGFVTFCGGILGAIFLPFAIEFGSGSEIFGRCIGFAIGGPIISYIALILFRLLGEQILAIGNIANDTREIVHNTRRH